jgi:hypothetical protein
MKLRMNVPVDCAKFCEFLFPVYDDRLPYRYRIRLVASHIASCIRRVTKSGASNPSASGPGRLRFHTASSRAIDDTGELAANLATAHPEAIIRIRLLLHPPSGLELASGKPSKKCAAETPKRRHLAPTVFTGGNLKFLAHVLQVGCSGCSFLRTIETKKKAGLIAPAQFCISSDRALLRYVGSCVLCGISVGILNRNPPIVGYPRRQA